VALLRFSVSTDNEDLTYCNFTSLEYGCEISSFTLMNEQGKRVFENWMLRIKDGTTGRRGSGRNDGLYNVS
jgi:hypothetical protein